VNSAQHQFFSALIQSAHESRIQLHDIAWVLLGVLLMMTVLLLSALWLWVLRGGFDDYFCLNSARGQRIVHEWLRKS
jgi:hypothetical protein